MRKNAEPTLAPGGAHDGQDRAARAGGPPALVLGSDITGLGVLRSLGRAGIPTLCVTGARDLVHGSRWFRPAPVRREGEPLTDYLSRIPLAEAVLIPCSDQTAIESARLGSDLAARFPSSLAPEAALRTLLDKGAFAALLTAEGLPHPYTMVARGRADLAAVPEAVWPTAFLKPRNSQAFFARYGVKALPVVSRDEVGDKVEWLRAAGYEMMIQEYIPGPASNHYFVDAFVDRNARISALFVRRRLRMFPPDFGNSTYMVSVAPEAAAGAVATVTRLVAQLGYRGALSAEFKHDLRDGQFKILEVNARPWWYVEFAQRCGVNVPLMMYRDALGLHVPTIQHYAVGHALVYPYYDLFACLPAWRAGTLSIAQWGWSWASSTKPLFAWDDPMPAIRSTTAWVGRHLFPKRSKHG
jgi:predicted ATP-grasp superfamily ATP-dependent carboligase